MKYLYLQLKVRVLVQKCIQNQTKQNKIKQNIFQFTFLSV